MGEDDTLRNNTLRLGEHILESNISDEVKQNRLEKRRLIEKVCEIAESNLTPQKKMLFLMYYRDGYKATDIASLLGINCSNVTRKLRRIQRELCQIDREIKKKRLIRKGQF